MGFPLYLFNLLFSPEHMCLPLSRGSSMSSLTKSSFPSLLLLYLLIHSLSPVFASLSLPTVICGKSFFYLLRTWSWHVMWWLQGELQILFIFYMSMYLSWWNQTRKLINWVVPIEDTVSIHFRKSIPKTDRMTSVGTKTMGSDTWKIYFYNTKVNYCNISQFTSLNHFTIAFRIYRKHLHVPIHNKWHHQHTVK